MNLKRIVLATGLVMAFGLGTSFASTRQMEHLSRGLVSANVGNGMLVSWRLLGTEKPNTEFNLYRDGIKIATIIGNQATNYLDATGKITSEYTVAPVNDGKEGKKQGLSLVYDETYKSGSLSFPYKTLTLDVPKDLTMPDGSTCSYTPNDMSVGDVDGDGELEMILKWDPSNSKDNSQSGYTGNVYIDAYKFNGKKLWRIDLGRNIRAGAHYTQFMVYDLNGDGKAEIAVKTSDGTVDGTGKVIGNASADYRTSSGTIMSGNEYLTIFDGETGAAINTIDYWPKRGLITGDNYGNRDNRMLAGIAYLDGVHPSLIVCRGYYTQAFVAAYDFDGSKLINRWQYSATKAGEGLYGEGNHNLSIGDVNGDGYDEIIFGSAALAHDGKLLYRTGFGHGDAMHLSDMDPDRAGLEVYAVHEEKTNKYAEEFRGPDGKVIWGTEQVGGGMDNGRGLAADIDATNRGFEMWSGASGGIRTVTGALLSTSKPSVNFRIYFDGDLQDELLDATGSGGSGGKIEKWNSTAKTIDRYFSFYNVNGSTLNNYTKANPCISADLFGDWREEFIARSSTNPAVITIFSTAVKTDFRLYTLLHDSQYRVSVAWQNVAYNQPPHVSYYLPDMVIKLTQPDIYTVDANGEIVLPDPTLTKNGAGPSSQNIVLGNAIVDFGYTFANCTGAEVSGLPKGVTATINKADSKVMISGTPTEAGSFKFTVKAVGGNEGVVVTKSGVIIVTDPKSEEPEKPVETKPEASKVDASTPVEGIGWTEKSNEGFIENGYFNFDNSKESFGTWNLSSEKATEATISVRFTNGGTAARDMDLIVNGEKVATLAMPATGAWTKYETVDAKINLVKGLNTITLQSVTTDGGANIDMFYFDVEGISAWTEKNEEKLEEIAALPKITFAKTFYNANTGVLRTNVAGYAAFKVFDRNGRMVMEHSAYVNAGESIVNLDQSALSSGVYFVKVILNGRNFTSAKFVKTGR